MGMSLPDREAPRRLPARALLVLLAVLPAAGAALPGPASAANCGGAMPCACGDTVIADTRLAADVGPCGRTGLNVASGVKLDCDGHRVFGGSSKDGILANLARDTTIRGCTVEGFRVGIRVLGGEDVVVAGNTVRGNERGIRIEKGTIGPRVDRNLVTRSKDLGMLILGATDIVVTGNVVVDNARGNARIEAVDKGSLTVNSFGGETRNDLEIRDSRRLVLRDNEILATAVRVNGDSRDNRFIENDVFARDYGFRFDTVKDKLGVLRIPTGNEVVGGSVLVATKCFRFSGASRNDVSDVVVRNCASRPYEEKTYGSAVPTGNRVDVKIVR